MCACMGIHSVSHMWKPGNNLQAFLLHFSSWGWSSDVRPGGRCVKILMVTAGGVVAQVGKPREKMKKEPVGKEGFAGS